MPGETYYGRTLNERANFWQNIVDHGAPALSAAGMTAAEVDGIILDARWAVYAYRSVRLAFDEFNKALTSYANGILNGTPNGQLPVAPPVPVLPPAPGAAVRADIEARRERWVRRVKNLPLYTKVVGATLGIESSAAPFQAATYLCELSGLRALGGGRVGGRFAKARGRVEGINLYGRRAGEVDWTGLGRFTATPFVARVPLASGAPESWELMARAVRRDVEFGLESRINVVVVAA